jgi:hypothetical protein
LTTFKKVEKSVAVEPNEGRGTGKGDYQVTKYTATLFLRKKFWEKRVGANSALCGWEL